MKSVKLGNKIVGDDNPCYIVAEIGGLFRNYDEAKRLIDSAVEIDVDAIKFQTLEADTVTIKNNYFEMEATGRVSQYDLLKEFEISKDLQKKVVNYANEKGLTIFSAPSHMKDLEIMKEMDLPIFKIGSDLACHIPLLKEVAKLGKPIILSTGMCTVEEIKESISAITSMGNDQVILLHCVSDYPTKIEETNLNCIPTMKNEFNIPVGLSDHTVNSVTTLAGAIMGANLIERHFKDIQNTKSPDDIHALDKKQFAKLIHDIKTFERSKGDGIKKPSISEMKNLKTNRVSIIALKNITAGETIDTKMIDIRRPGIGLKPKFFNQILGMKAKRDIKKEEPLSFDMLE